MGVCDDGDKVGGADDGTDGGSVEDDMRGVQLTGCCKHSVGVCDDGDKTGGSDDGADGGEDGGDIREVQLTEYCNRLWTTCFFPLHFEGFLRFVVRCFTFCQLILRMKNSFVRCTSFSSRVTSKRAYMRFCQSDFYFLALKTKCRSAFIGGPVQPSVNQHQVIDALRDMGLSVEDEFR